MNILNIVIDSLYEEDKEMMCEGMVVSPLTAFLCSEDINNIEFVKYNSEDENYINESFISDYKANLSNKEIKSISSKSKKDVAAEKKAMRKKQVSKITNTDYRLSAEQKRFLKILKKKYGKELLKEISEYRTEILAPYQVIKNNLEGSKAIHGKEVAGMTREEYKRAKKSAERKIHDLGQGKYKKLIKDYGKLTDRENMIDDMDLGSIKSDLSKPALTKMFKTYGLYSYRFEDADFKNYQSKINNTRAFIDKLNKGLTTKTNKENAEALKKMFDEVKAEKSAIISSGKTVKQRVSKEVKDTLDQLKDTQNVVQSIEIKIKDSNELSAEDKEDILKDFDNEITQNKVKITSTSFADEYEMYLMREKIKEDIKNNVSNKYTEEYNSQVNDLKNFISKRKNDTIRRMANTTTIFTEKENKIYKLKAGRRKDSDKLEDYELKIKPEDFFESKYYVKSDEIKDAEKKLGRTIKQFERNLASRLSEGDYKLLKKYRLINNLLVIKKNKKEK